jgi:hypothetical protein
MKNLRRNLVLVAENVKEVVPETKNERGHAHDPVNDPNVLGLVIDEGDHVLVREDAAGQDLGTGRGHGQGITNQREVRKIGRVAGIVTRGETRIQLLETTIRKRLAMRIRIPRKRKSWRQLIWRSPIPPNSSI